MARARTQSFMRPSNVSIAPRQAPAKKLIEKKSSQNDSKWFAYHNKEVVTWTTLNAFDEKRKQLLALARNGSAIDTIFRMKMMKHTVLPRILRHPATWVVFMAYCLAAFVTRYDLINFANIEDSVNEGASTLVTFMIVFYVGHCYGRYHDKFMDVEMIMQSIVNVCTLCRAHFDDPDEVHRVWRYLNLGHCAAYCGLTDGYNMDNFFLPLAEKYNLLGYGKDNEEERAVLKVVDIDEEGLRTVEMYQVWALDVIRRESTAMKGGLSPPIQKAIEDEVLAGGNAIKRLYAYYYQVLPFIYTHLVSASCTIYLVINAFLKGLYFTRDSEYTFGLWLPAANVIITTLGVFGLLEVGDTIIDPFGGDPEDFAVTHLVEWTASVSLDAVMTQRRRKGTHQERDNGSMKKTTNRYAFNSDGEFRAALTMAKLASRWKRRNEVRKLEREKALEARRVAKAANGGFSPACSPACSRPGGGGVCSSAGGTGGSDGVAGSSGGGPSGWGYSPNGHGGRGGYGGAAALQRAPRSPKQKGKPRRSCDEMSPSMPLRSEHPGRAVRPAVSARVNASSLKTPDARRAVMDFYQTGRSNALQGLQVQQGHGPMKEQHIASASGPARPRAHTVDVSDPPPAQWDLRSPQLPGRLEA